MGKRPVTRGPTGERVSANIRQLREDRRMSLAELSRALGEAGRPMAPSAVYKIETGERRIDVDDLVAFALALGEPPNALLLPDARTETGRVPLTATMTAADPKAAWLWATVDPSLYALGWLNIDTDYRFAHPDGSVAVATNRYWRKIDEERPSDG
jgi:transcriptional regulator with XRE-family HTH domain